MNLVNFLNLETVGTIILIVVCVNIGLGAAGKILDKIKDKTETKLDNKIAAIINKVTPVLSKLLDWVGANRAHK